MSGKLADEFDVLVIGGGVNGCGVTRDAVGRGLRVMLVEQGDLANGTSSASTKLFHGGLRYLEHYEFKLVRKALEERETLLRTMPHISWPMRFVLPKIKGMRPAWMLRAGLYVYDYIGKRKLLPPTKTVWLNRSPLGAPLKAALKLGFEYSDCWVDDSRLVVLNARDAADRGAKIKTNTRFESAVRNSDHWIATLRDTKTKLTKQVRAKVLVNAGGPWVNEIITDGLQSTPPSSIRLVRGSHIVTKKLYEHDRAFFFQNDDGRLIFTIPYERDYTLIGTTDVDHVGAIQDAECSAEEQTYLCGVVSKYFKKQISDKDVIWSYAGIRPLNDDLEGNAAMASRDYTIELDRQEDKAPAIHIFGGKITTYRKLAEQVVAELSPFVGMIGKKWTGRHHLPGGDFEPIIRADLVADLKEEFSFLEPQTIERLFSAYGTETATVLRHAKTKRQLGKKFGADLHEAELIWLRDKEWATTAEDVVWRRSKLGLRMTDRQISAVEDWMRKTPA